VRESTYELCYNSACYALATGDVDKAEDMLGRATAMCNKEFEDDPEEAKSELAPIQVQQAVCLQRQGDSKEAMNIYTNVIKEKCGDTQTIAVAANNIISINKDQSMFDSKKKLKLASGETINKKLSKHQIISVDFNQCLLSYYTNQLDQFKKQSLRLSEEGSPLAPLLLATSHIRDKRSDLALSVLGASDLNNETVLLALGELQLNANSLSDAADTLQKITSWSDKPGLLSTVISLLMASRSPGEASSFFDEAINRLRNTGNYTAEQLSEWTLENARFKMSHDMPENAADVLESLLQSEPSNIKALALLISSVSMFDAPRAHEVAQRLPPITIPDDVNVDNLEMGVGVTSGRGLRKVIKPDEEKIKEANRKFETKEKKRKKKKGKLPKEMATAGPDPERWIKRQERSYYRRKKRNRNEVIGKGSQGLSSVNTAAAAALDMSDKPKAAPAPAAAIPEEPAAGAAKPPAPVQAKAKPKGKKKKGKGW